MGETRPFLIYRNMLASESTSAVYKFVDGFLTQIGSNFGTQEAIAASVEKQGRVAHFNNNLYVVNNNNLYAYVPASGDWDVAFNFTKGKAWTSSISQWTPVTIRGEPHLIAFYPTSTTSFTDIRISSSGTFSHGKTKTFGFNLFDSTYAGFLDTIVTKDSVYWIGGRFVNFVGIVFVVYRWFSDLDIVQLDPGQGGNASIRLVLCNEKIYKIILTGTLLEIYEIIGVTPTLLTTITTTSAGGRMSVWSDEGTNIYILYPDSISSKWSLVKINVITATKTDLTSVVIPTTIQSYNLSTGYFSEYIDVEGNPGGIPRRWIFASPTQTGGSSYAIYEFIDDSTLLSFIGDGADSLGFSLPCEKKGAGIFTWNQDNELNVTLSNPIVAGTEITFDFKLYGNTSGVSLEFYFENGDGIRNNKATLISSTIGSLTSSTISGLTATIGGTSGTVVWAAAVDGIQQLDYPTIVGYAFLP